MIRGAQWWALRGTSLVIFNKFDSFGAIWDHGAAYWGPFGTIRGQFKSIGNCKPSGNLLGPFGKHLGPHEVVFGSTGGTFWNHLSDIGTDLNENFDFHKTRVKHVLKLHFRDHVESFWNHLGTILGSFGTIRGHCGAIWGHSGTFRGHLGSFQSISESSWVKLWSFWANLGTKRPQLGPRRAKREPKRSTKCES